MTKLRKRSGGLEDFDEAKLRASMGKAGATDEHARRASEIVARDFREGMESSELRRMAASELSKMDKASARKYEAFTNQ